MLRPDTGCNVYTNAAYGVSDATLRLDINAGAAGDPGKVFASLSGSIIL